MHFRVKRTALLKKASYFLVVALQLTNLQVMCAFCERVALDPRSIKFLFEGNILVPEATPESLDMENGDEIDAMMQQIGGVGML